MATVKKVKDLKQLASLVDDKKMKIIEAKIQASEESDEVDDHGEKLKTRISKLEDVRDKLDKCVVSLAKLYIMDQPAQVKYLTLALRIVKGILADPEKPQGITSHIKKCVNELTSLREGVYISRVDKKTLAVTACQAAYDYVVLLIEKAKKNLSKGPLGLDEADQPEDEIIKILKRSQKESKKLESLKGRDFAVSRVPLVPVAKGFLSTQKLKDSGFDVESIDGYNVIHNQLVLGINPNSLNLKSDKSSSIPRAKWLQVAERVKGLLEKKLKVKLVFVDDKPYGAAGGAWFWLMPANEAKLLASAFPGGHIKVERWGFAF